MAAEAQVFPDASRLMVLETPLLRVSRPVAACSRCRAAKVKCDGKLPACTACERANRAHECSSTNDQFAKGKERSYVATLESRIEKLERKIAEAKDRRKSSLMMLDYDTSHPSRRPSRNPAAARKLDRRSRRRKEASDIDDLVSDFGFLAVHSTTRDFYGFTSAMSYSRLVLAASSKEPLPSDVMRALPPKYATTSQLQHYMNNAFVLMPILDEASFHTSIDAVYAQDSTLAQPFDHWVVRLVLAIASISLSEERGDTHYLDAIGHITAALEHAEEVLQPGAISTVQALVMLTTYSLADPHHFDAWTLSGAASRAMVDIGLHQEPPKMLQIPKAKLQTRRRVFYCVYCLDRSIAMTQSRALSFSDDSAHVEHPFTNRSGTRPTTPPRTQLWLPSLDAFLELVKLRQMQSDWYQTLYQSSRTPWADPYPYIWHTYRAMTEWFNNLSTSVMPSIKSFFEINLIHSYVLILSPNSKVPRISDYAQRLIFEHCVACATKTLAIVGDNSSATRSPITVSDAMKTYVIGRTFIDILSHNQEKLLGSAPPIPPSSTAVAEEENLDPMDRAASVPPLPDPIANHVDDSSVNGDSTTSLRQTQSPPPSRRKIPLSTAYSPTESTNRAIAAINNFTTTLTRFGMRFGLMALRDRFQQESTPLMNQLCARSQRLAQQQQQADEIAASFSNNVFNNATAYSGSPPSMQVPGGFGTVRTPPQGVVGLSPQQPRRMVDSTAATMGGGVWPGLAASVEQPQMSGPAQNYGQFSMPGTTQTMVGTTSNTPAPGMMAMAPRPHQQVHQQQQYPQQQQQQQQQQHQQRMHQMQPELPPPGQAPGGYEAGGIPIQWNNMPGNA